MWLHRLLACLLLLPLLISALVTLQTTSPTRTRPLPPWKLIELTRNLMLTLAEVVFGRSLIREVAKWTQRGRVEQAHRRSHRRPHRRWVERRGLEPTSISPTPLLWIPRSRASSSSSSTCHPLLHLLHERLLPLSPDIGGEAEFLWRSNPEITRPDGEAITWLELFGIPEILADPY